jgi:hypothetical protein
MKRRLYSRSTLLLLALAAGSAWADADGTRASAAARYETERAMCLRGESTQDRDTCLQEAGAAYAQAKRGRAMPDENEAQLEANRLQRCEPLPAEQRRDCIARMHGEGTISGSVAEGGIYRELVTIVPAGEDDARSDKR